MAIPAAAFAVFIVHRGGLVLAVALIALGALALLELSRMMNRLRPVPAAAILSLAGLVLAALYGGRAQVLAALVASVPLTFGLAFVGPVRKRPSLSTAVTMLGIVWIGLAMAHGVLLRELPHGGALLLDVLIGTFLGDTAAHLVGTAWGRTPLARRVSPRKTVEGLVAGLVVGTFAVWLVARLFQDDWLSSVDALLLGAAIAAAAPLGDLFESAVKRDFGVKDTGRIFGAHGGVLDRLDAVLFSAVAAYYVSSAAL